MKWKPFLRTSERACKEEIVRRQKRHRKQKVQQQMTPAMIWQCNHHSGEGGAEKWFCVAGEQEMFDCLRREQQKSNGDFSWYEFITSREPGYAIWDVDWYIKGEVEK